MSSDPAASSELPRLPEELPPVQPPSGAFIAQLFLVPGLIVCGIVLVWLLVTRMASTEQDWRTLVVELKSGDDNRRWRAAFGLAQLLQSDQSKPPSQARLIENKDIAQSLADLLHAEIGKASAKDADIQFHAFLARTMGLLDAPTIVEPALEETLDPARDLEIRKNGLSAIAMIISRDLNQGEPNPLTGLEDELIEVSASPDHVLRQIAALTLGQFSTPAAKDRLQVLLNDADLNTQANAALGLTLQGSTAGLAVLERMIDPAPRQANSDEYSHELSQTNGLKAIEKLAPKFSPTERQSLIEQVDKLINTKGQSQVRIHAQNALHALHAVK